MVNRREGCGQWKEACGHGGRVWGVVNGRRHVVMEGGVWSWREGCGQWKEACGHGVRDEGCHGGGGVVNGWRGVVLHMILIMEICELQH